LVYFLFVWYIFSRFGILYQEKSGNHAEAASERGKKLKLPTLRFFYANEDRESAFQHKQPSMSSRDLAAAALTFVRNAFCSK
jgi:hypothetical protein